jgi:hypothetical protein
MRGTNSVCSRPSTDLGFRYLRDKLPGTSRRLSQHVYIRETGLGTSAGSGNFETKETAPIDVSTQHLGRREVMERRIGQIINKPALRLLSLKHLQFNAQPFIRHQADSGLRCEQFPAGCITCKVSWCTRLTGKLTASNSFKAGADYHIRSTGWLNSWYKSKRRWKLI